MVDCEKTQPYLICISPITTFLELKRRLMKKIFPIIAGALSLVFISACTTPTTKGYELAKENKYDASYVYLGVKDPDLVKATDAALRKCGWNYSNEGNTFKAEYLKDGLKARLNIKVENNKVYMNSKGSTLDFQPIVPVLYMEMLKDSIRRSIKA